MNKRQKGPNLERNIQHVEKAATVKPSDGQVGDKKTESKRKGTSETYSRKHLAPEKLAWLIEIVNLLPPGDFAGWTCRALWEYAEREHESFEQLMKRMIERLPERPREFVGIFPTMEDIEDGDPKVLEYVKANSPYDWRINLIEILRIQLEVQWRYDLLQSGWSALHGIAQGELSNNREIVLDLPQRIGKDLKGNIELKPSGLSAYISGVNSVRIRECPVCQKIFWAERKDLKACPGDCTRSLRNRRYHKSYLEKYKLQRIQKADVAEKKNLKKGR